MIRAMALYLAGVPPVFTDGLTYVLIAFFGAWSAQLSTDEAAKYITPQMLFWLKSFATTVGASLLALKMFRSTTFADQQKAKADTAFLTRPTNQP